MTSLFQLSTFHSWQ